MMPAAANGNAPLFAREPDPEADWQPINLYDKDVGQAVMLRDVVQEMFGRWSKGDDNNPEPSWRAIIDAYDGTPLWFEPTHFADLSDADRQLLMEAL
jgi:hypothetical protein